MNTYVSVNRQLIGVIAVMAFGLMLASMPQTAGAHEGEMHRTVEEAQKHLRESQKGTGSRASTTVDTTCMADAVNDREDALIEAWEDMSSSTMLALEDRREGLVDAWGMSNMKDRAVALVKVWKEWRAEKKAITAEFRKDRKAAWDEFKKTAKDECKTKLPKDEAQEKAASDTIAI